MILYVQPDMKKPAEAAYNVGDEVPALIASTPASVQHRRTAFGVVIVLSAAFAASMPFAAIQVTRVDAFLTVSQAIVLFAEILTAIFLFSQFSIQPRPALLALASGYICSGLFAFLQTLDFPGAYSATGIITGTPSGAVWFFFFWRITFPLAVIAYVALKDAKEAANPTARIEPGRAIGITVACALATTAGLSWLLAAGHLPSLNVGATQQPLVQYFAVVTWSLNTIAVVLLFIRRRTILDVWLIVAVFVSLPDLTLAIFYAVTIRFSVGWYIGKAFLLIGSWTVLVVLLWETMMLYARLVGAMILQRRERVYRIMSVDEATSAIAHELNQPLGALSLNCDAALECLKTAPLDIEELRSCLSDAKNDSARASGIVSGVRALFRSAPGRRTIVEINSLVREVLRMVENDVRVQGIAIASELQEDLPRIAGDQIQLQQVILNLVKNAIDALVLPGPEKAKSIRVVTSRGPNSGVSLLVQDTGPGITPEREANIFDPFFTTKSSGMGLGLSISRRIIEDHSGSLRLIETNSNGCTFEITLPVSQPAAA
jgi:signal transduction histidine kinase